MNHAEVASFSAPSPTLTNEQLAVIASPARVLAVDAFAGTGKTSTLVEYAKARPGEKILYLAFNRSIAASAKERFPGHVQCRTTHSLAFGAVGRRFADKLGNLSSHEVAGRLRCTVRQAKLAMETVNTWLTTVDVEIGPSHISAEAEFEDSSEPGAVVERARVLWSEMQDLRSPLKMTHDGYLKLWAMSQPRLSFDRILLDEAQDTSPLVVKLVMDQARHAGIVLVGDRHQGIYGFRGAINAMEAVSADTRVAITKSFRFGAGIACLATAILQIFKQETNTVTGRDDIQVQWAVRRTQHYAILARTNAALFEEAARLVDGRRVAIHYVGGFEGYFFGQVLDAYFLWADQRASIKDAAIARFTDFASYKKYGQESKDPQIKAMVKVVEYYRDRVPQIYNLMKAAERPEEYADVTLATAHKAKGLEWQQVVLTDDFVALGEIEANPAPEVLEEVNLLYVAVTRAIAAIELPAALSAWAEDAVPGLQSAAAASGTADTPVSKSLSQPIQLLDCLGDVVTDLWQGKTISPDRIDSALDAYASLQTLLQGSLYDEATRLEA